MIAGLTRLQETIYLTNVSTISEQMSVIHKELLKFRNIIKTKKKVFSIRLFFLQVLHIISIVGGANLRSPVHRSPYHW